MNEIHQIQEYLNKIQDLYCESFFEKRMNSESSDDRINEFQLMMEQINQDQGVIENIIEICQFLIGTLSIKQDEEQEQIDYHEKQKKQLEESLKTEREEIDQYKNLFLEKCQVITEQLQIIQDLEFQNNFLKSQNQILEKQSVKSQREQIDNDSITQIVYHQEEQLQRNANYILELEQKSNKLKQELQATKIEIENQKQQIKELNKINKSQFKELSSAKLSIQQQEALIQSLEQDLRIQNDMVIELQNQVSSYKDQLIQIHHLQRLDHQIEIEKKSSIQDQILQISNYSQQVEKIQRSDSVTTNQANNGQNLKIQLPLLSHRAPVFKYMIPEVSERHEHSESPQKTQKEQKNENFATVSAFEVNKIDKESIHEHSVSFYEEKQEDLSIKLQPISQTARGNQKQVPRFQFLDLNNRITVARQRKSKTQEPSGIIQYKELLKQNKNETVQKTGDPYKIFFDLLVQCEKINSEYFDDIYSIDTSSLYTDCMKERLPYYEWQKWISNQLNRDLQ